MASIREPDPPVPGEVELRPPPPLPPRLLALPPLVYVGTGLWALATAVLAVAHYGFGIAPPIWLWTAGCGTVLGFISVPVMVWQRRASRRGSRAAQRNL